MTSGGKWIKPSAIVAAIVLGLGVGFYVWDHHYYPIPSILYSPSSAADPFAEAEGWSLNPSYAERSGLISFINTLVDQKIDRYNRRMLPQFNLCDHHWEYFQPVDGKNQWGNTVTFHKNGSLSYEGDPIHSSLKNESIIGYERSRFDELKFKTRDEEFTFKMSIHAPAPENDPRYVVLSKEGSTWSTLLRIPYR